MVAAQEAPLAPAILEGLGAGAKQIGEAVPKDLGGTFENILGGKKKADLKPAESAGPKDKPNEYGTIEVRKIKLGYMSEDLAEVDSGIQEGDMVVVEVQEEFKDKARVEIAEVQEGLI